MGQTIGTENPIVF